MSLFDKAIYAGGIVIPLALLKYFVLISFTTVNENLSQMTVPQHYFNIPARDYKKNYFEDEQPESNTKPWWQVENEYFWNQTEVVDKVKAEFDARSIAQFFEVLLDHPKSWNGSPFDTRGHVEEYLRKVENEANNLNVKGWIMETEMTTLAIYMEGVRKTLLAQFIPFFKQGTSNLEVRKYRMTMWTAITHYSLHNFEIIDTNETMYKHFLGHIGKCTWVGIIPDSSEEDDDDDIEKYRNETWLKKHNYFLDSFPS